MEEPKASVRARGIAMRIQLKDAITSEALLEDLVQVSFSVFECHCPPGLRDDLRMGLYVALRQVLSADLVKRSACGNLPDCADLPEESAFPPTERYAHPHHSMHRA